MPPRTAFRAFRAKVHAVDHELHAGDTDVVRCVGAEHEQPGDRRAAFRLVTATAGAVPSLSTVTVTAAPVCVFPAASRATAAITCGPLATVPLFHTT